MAQVDDLSLVTAIAERVLTGTFGAMVRLAEPEPLDASPGSQVARFAVREGPSDAPATVIVKRAGVDDAADTGTPDSPAQQLFDDWTGLQFLDRAAGDASPAARFYGGDRAAQLIVMEDLGPGPYLHTLLLGDAPLAAEEAVVGLAATLGRMHALTIGKADEFHRLRDALGPGTWQARHDDYDWLAPTFHAMAAALDIPRRPRADAELDALRAVLRDPGPFLAYIHGDACPDNCVRVGPTVRLFDFEHGRFGHALIDGVYGRMPFPSCWCIGRLPERVALRMENAYRAALVQGCPAAADDALFYRAVVEACIYWLIAFDRWYPLPTILERDEEWDAATIRQRLLFRFDVVARTMQDIGHLPALGVTVAAMAARLRSLWAAGTAPMPYYPAFMSGDSQANMSATG